jgi:3-methylfumaryl-CoA hydratase
VTLRVEELKQWIGRTETLADEVTPAPVRGLAALLDRGDPPLRRGDPVPPCWHWLYFLPAYRQSDIDADGHGRRGVFLPPIPLPRRMWAGSRIEFVGPLRVGDAVTRTSTIVDVSAREGRTGSLVFVKVRHEIAAAQSVSVIEEQDIVYRGVPQPGAAPASRPAPADEQFSHEIVPDPVLLFRYSALTFNGHRIHYDRPYATMEEGYAGLVVHGPLTATLLLEQLHRAQPGTRVRAFEFKAISPLFDSAPFAVCGRLDGDKATLWARGPLGQLAMQATATITRD